MANSAKIHLSEKEMALVSNSEWILDKQNVIKKVYEMFGILNEEYRRELTQCNYLPITIKNDSGKIFKGENYLGLPYVILDHPAHFSKTDVFAIRTMFWWGNYFSITLHVSGIYKDSINKCYSKVLELLKEKDFSICINDEEWHHELSSENYKPAILINEEDSYNILSKTFFKAAMSVPLNQWDKAISRLEAYFRDIIEIACISYPSDEKGL